MTIYDEISSVFRETLPHRLALSKTIEELPHMLRDALSGEIGAPKSYALVAQKIADWLKTSRADPRAAFGESTPIGFGRGTRPT